MYSNKLKKFYKAIDKDDIKKVTKYLKKIDPSANNNEAIRLASEYGHLEVVRLLLSDSRVDPSANNNEAIRSSSRGGYTEIVELLLSDSRVDPSAHNNYAIRFASREGYTKIVKLLLSNSRVDPSVDNNYAIRLASQEGYTEIVKLLLSDPRVDFNAISSEKKKNKLLQKEKDKLRNELVSRYKIIERASPQIKFDETTKSQIPSPLIKRTVYEASYLELCLIIPGKFPPIKLLALADLLKIEYNKKTTYEELCGKVKLVLLNF